MPLDVLGCTRATLKGSACFPCPIGPGNPLNPLRGRDCSLQLFSMNQEFLVNTWGATEISRRSRGTPRISNRLLRRVRDVAQVRGDGSVTKAIADEALNLLNVDKEGFDAMDRRLLMTIIDKFAGGPVGLDSVAAAISEERGTIEDVLEPYLIQQGYLMRTPRGRIATAKSYQHFGLRPPEQVNDAEVHQDRSELD